MKLILLGAPGSGKGTVSDFLANKFKLKHISTGEICREEMAKNTAFGTEIKHYMDKGNLVPDELMIKVVNSTITGKDDYILDGFPRTIPQAEAIISQKIDAVINLDLPESAVIERLSGRRMCQNCNSGYHIKYIKPKKEGICDKCGSKLIQRPDDTPKVISERFKDYHTKTKPLVEYYQKKKLLHTIDASPPPETVRKAVTELVKELKRN
ncbi:nucleoside monophosphate kinase [Candidatus Woesearchaeota archaeon]|nr:nucleoside monophosphate kinase [Candidatus Woesearchaeota archaeon]